MSRRMDKVRALKYKHAIDRALANNRRMYEQWLEDWHKAMSERKPKGKSARKEIPGKLEWFEGELREVVDASRSGWWRFHEHYDRNGYCDNPGRGY